MLPHERLAYSPIVGRPRLALPGDAKLAAQWPKYQPLRDWAFQANVATTSILDATVFTV